MKSMGLSDGERLILHMLGDLFKHLGVTSDIDPDLLQAAIRGGHSWAIRRSYPVLFEIEERFSEVSRETYEILSMWQLIKSSFTHLTENESARVCAQAQIDSADIKFLGFNKSDEVDILSVAKFAVEKLKEFPELKDDQLNANRPTLEMHRRMLEVLRSTGAWIANRDLDSDELIKLLNTCKQPLIH